MVKRCETDVDGSVERGEVRSRRRVAWLLSKSTRRRDGAINRDFNWIRSDCSNSKVKFHEYVTCVYGLFVHSSYSKAILRKIEKFNVISEQG